MDDTPITKRPWFYIASWMAFLVIVYGWQIYRIYILSLNDPDWGMILLKDVILDVILFVSTLLLWIAFFAQFVLPVRTFEDRQKIFDRLLTYLSGGHGPAIFIRNGEQIKREGEENRKGPGVLWLDSASAAVTRTATKIKQTMGPGVHFIDSGEFIASTLDLHTQSDSVGPKASDNLFEEQGDMDEDEWKQIQERRKQVSGWTRDGIEIIPNISVSFRVRTGFPKEGKLGSRFGYRIGNTPKDKLNEEEDKKAIRDAILGEGIHPNEQPDSLRRRVAWNEFPASLAVDVWREYVSKFTLDELFKAEQVVPAPEPKAPQPTDEEIDPLSQPLQVSSQRNNLQDSLTAMLREMNLLMNRAIKWLEREDENKNHLSSTLQPLTQDANQKQEPKKATALQVITDMVNARLKEAQVDFLDDHGQRGNHKIESPEYKLLLKHGLEVKSVGISNPRFDPEIEETIKKRWSASWLSNANAEKGQIERKRNIMETAGQEKALRQYADQLSSDLTRKKPLGARETLKTLLTRTRAIIIQDDQLRKRMAEEQQDIDEIIKTIEANGS